MCTCSCVYMHVQVCASRGQTSGAGVSLIHSPPWLLERRPLVGPGDQLYCLANESQGSCVSASLALELQACLTFLSGCWGWNSDPRACLSSTFLTEPSPQSHI